MKYIVLLGRIFFSIIFISPFYKLVSGKMVDYAATAGVPMASVLLPLAGIIALAGGLLILLGFKARIGGWLIVIFLVPVTLFMHAFWKLQEPAKSAEMLHFTSNLALLGAALLIAYFGSGPASIDSLNEKK